MEDCGSQRTRVKSAAEVAARQLRGSTARQRTRGHPGPTGLPPQRARSARAWKSQMRVTTNRRSGSFSQRGSVVGTGDPGAAGSSGSPNELFEELVLMFQPWFAATIRTEWTSDVELSQSCSTRRAFSKSYSSHIRWCKQSPHQNMGLRGPRDWGRPE